MPTRRHNPSSNSSNNSNVPSDPADIFRSHPETVNLVGFGTQGRAFVHGFFQAKDLLPPLTFIGVDAHAPGRHETPRDEHHYHRLSAIPDHLRRQLLHAFGWALRGAAALFIAQDENPAPAEQEEIEALTVLAQDRSIPVFRVALWGREGRRLPQSPAAKALQRLSDATLVLPHTRQDSLELQGLRWLFAALLHLAQEGAMVWQSWDMADVQEVLCMPGTVLYAMTAEATGPVRAEHATREAIGMLADQGIELEIASGVLVIVAAGEDLQRLREMREAVDVIRHQVGSDVFILPLTPELGYASPEDVLTVTVVVSVRTA